MKCKNLMFIFFCYFISLTMQAQFGIDEIKKSKIVKDEITISIVDENNLDLYIDLENITEKTLKESDYFQVKSNEFRVYANFVNPFEYIFRSSQKTLDDELFIASQDFIQNAASYISQAQSASSRGKNNRPIPAAPSNDKLEPELVEMYTMVIPYDTNFFTTNTEFWNSMTNLDLAEANEGIAKKYTDAFTALKEITELTKIPNIISTNKTSLDGNKQIIDNLNSKFTKLKIEFEKITFAANQLHLKTYIENVISKLDTKIKELESLKTNVDSKYDKIQEFFSDIHKRQHKLGINKFLISKINDINNSKRHEINIIVEKLSFNDSEKSIKIESSKSFLVNVRKKTSFIPVLSSGVLYTNLSFSQFGTDTNEAGQTIITQTEDKENEIAIAAYLNLYLNNNWSVPLFLQFGVGPSKEKPLFFLGAGFELAPKFTLSTGAVFTWMPKLNALNVGDVVGGSSIINDDIRYDFDLNPKFYIGISIDITKK